MCLAPRKPPLLEMSNAFAANIQILDELTNQFSLADDPNRVIEIQNAYDSMKSLIAQREGNIRQTIKREF